MTNDEVIKDVLSKNEKDFWQALVADLDYGIFGYDPYYAQIRAAYMKRAREILRSSASL